MTRQVFSWTVDESSLLILETETSVLVESIKAAVPYPKRSKSYSAWQAGESTGQYCVINTGQNNGDGPNQINTLLLKKLCFFCVVKKNGMYLLGDELGLIILCEYQNNRLLNAERFESATSLIQTARKIESHLINAVNLKIPDWLADYQGMAAVLKELSLKGIAFKRMAVRTQQRALEKKCVLNGLAPVVGTNHRHAKLSLVAILLVLIANIVFAFIANRASNEKEQQLANYAQARKHYLAQNMQKNGQNENSSESAASKKIIEDQNRLGQLFKKLDQLNIANLSLVFLLLNESGFELKFEASDGMALMNRLTETDDRFELVAIRSTDKGDLLQCKLRLP